MSQPTYSAQLVFDGEEDRQPFFLQKIITTIGRNESNDLLLDDPKVSSFHGNILYREDGYHLLDMKSRNGTWVNGKRISMCPLMDGDSLEFGDIRLVFRTPSLFQGGKAPLSRLGQKIQTMAIASPAFKKDAEEILREVEKHRQFLGSLIEIITAITESRDLDAFAKKLDAVFVKLLDCRNIELHAEKPGSAAPASPLSAFPLVLSNLVESGSLNGSGPGRLLKNISVDGEVKVLLAFKPSPEIGWIAYLASGVLPSPKDEVMDLLDLVLLFASILWRNLHEIALLHQKETENLLREKDRESRHIIQQLERKAEDLGRYVKDFQNRLVFAEGSPMERVLDLTRKLASVDLPVLITGETGTGKTYIAGILHHSSARAPRGFHVIDCATIPANLIESELFGHEKGAFTGAGARRIGKVEAAAGGTLFLDEIGDLPLELQGKLLRFVQEGRFERLGGNETVHVDVRIVAATNYDLEERVRQGRFRQDLFFRLHVLPLHVPPLRERVKDIPVLARHFVQKHFEGEGFEFTADALEAISRHPWPGNVRELENKLQRAWLFHSGGVITAADLGFGPPALPGIEAEPDLPLEKKTLEQYREEFESAILLRCLKFYKGNITKCAEHLEISRNTCKSMFRKYGIHAGYWDKD